MINVFNQIELLPKLPALTFLSRSQSTIAKFPKRPFLEISQKSALPYELVGWNWQIEVAKNFFRNCKPKFLLKFWLNFFNQYFHRHFFYFYWALCFLNFASGTSNWKFYATITSKHSLLNDSSLNTDLFFQNNSPCLLSLSQLTSVHLQQIFQW